MELNEIIGVCVMGILLVAGTCVSTLGYFNYKKYKKKIQIGTKLTHTYSPDNEFEPPTTFVVEVINVGKKQVKIKFSDNSTSIYTYYMLYEEGWEIL